MTTVLLTFVFMGGLMAAMSVGVIFSNKRLRGSCGGTGLDCTCTDPQKLAACERRQSTDDNPDKLVSVDSLRRT